MHELLIFENFNYLEPSVMSLGRETDLSRYGRSASCLKKINERLTGRRCSTIAEPALKPTDNRVGAGRCEVTDGMSRWPTSGVLPERLRICMAIVERANHDWISHVTLQVSRKLSTPLGEGDKPCVQQDRSAYNGRCKAIVLPERGLADCFLEQKAGRAR